MPGQGVYGQSLGDHFDLDDAPVIVTRTLKRSEVAVTHTKCRKPSMTSSIPIEDAYLVAYRIEDCIEHELWINGKGAGRLPFFAGQTCFYVWARPDLLNPRDLELHDVLPAGKRHGCDRGRTWQAVWRAGHAIRQAR